MKRIKKLLILIVVILLSGCSVEYNLTINEDLSVNESVTATEKTHRMNSNTGLNTKSSVNYLYKMFDRDNLKTRIVSETKDYNTSATVKGSHDSIDNYVNNFTSDVFKEVNYTKKDNVVTLTFPQTEVLSSTSSRSLVYDDITVNIIVPFKVIDNNAKYVNRDKYTWKIEKEQDLQNIKISFDTSNLKYKKRISIGNKTLNIRYSYFILFSFVLIIAIIVAIVFINNKKNNKI